MTEKQKHELFVAAMDVVQMATPEQTRELGRADEIIGYSMDVETFERIAAIVREIEEGRE